MTVDRVIPDFFDVEIPYVKRNNNGELPNHAQMFSWEEEFLDMLPGTVRNVRAANETFSIAKTGFEYARLEEPPAIDFSDENQVKAEYFPQLEKMVKEKYVSFRIFCTFWSAQMFTKLPRLGASEVKAFHHVVRNTNYEAGMGYTRKHRCPARRPHVDVTTKFAPILMSWDAPDMLKDITENGKHWQMVNAWKPLKPIRKSPVAVVHTASITWDDYLTVPQPEVGPGTEGFWLQRPQDPDRQHEWWFMESQTPEEVLLFLQHDSDGAQVVGHTSFQLPGEVPKEARESTETRLFVVY